MSPRQTLLILIALVALLTAGCGNASNTTSSNATSNNATSSNATSNNATSNGQSQNGVVVSVALLDYSSFCAHRPGCEQALVQAHYAFWDDQAHKVVAVYRFDSARPWQSSITTTAALVPHRRYDPRLYFQLNGKDYINDVVDEINPDAKTQSTIRFRLSEAYAPGIPGQAELAAVAAVKVLPFPLAR